MSWREEVRAYPLFAGWCSSLREKRQAGEGRVAQRAAAPHRSAAASWSFDRLIADRGAPPHDTIDFDAFAGTRYARPLMAIWKASEGWSDACSHGM